MDSSAAPTTPTVPISFTNPADLSPPSSQGAPALNSSPMANANGKRPLSTLDSNGDTSTAPMTRSAGTTGLSPGEIMDELKTHQGSGYTWRKAEDAPGWAWSNKRAVEEASRAWEGLLFKDHRIGSRFGDPFEMADSEAAMMASERQR